MGDILAHPEPATVLDLDAMWALVDGRPAAHGAAQPPRRDRPATTDQPAGRTLGEREVRSAMSETPGDATPLLLVVEDDDSIAAPLEEGLTREGFVVERVRTGEAALAAEQPDFVLLDLGLPDLDGGEVCRRLRSRSDVPIIVITARSDELDRVLLLEMGADDYVVKPFGFRELVARIRAVRRRTSSVAVASAAADVQLLGPLQIDRAARRVTIDGEEVELTPKEFDLLGTLARQPGQVCERHDLIEQVWDEHWWGSTKTLDVHIAGLRRKLGHPEWITTMRGVGYRFDGPS